MAQKLRVPIGFVIAAAVLYFAAPTVASIIIGLPVALLGAAFRALAAGVIKKDATLATSGVYSLTRNPLYFGSSLLAGGFAIMSANGIAAALFHRERTGEAQVVDVSLLGTAMWVMSPDVVASKLIGQPKLPLSSRAARPNPAVNNYRTKDGRWLILPRYTLPDTDTKMLLHKLRIDLPAQPPPRITAVLSVSTTAPASTR